MKGLLMNDQVYQIAVDIAAQFSQSPDVVAIALSGSYASGHGDDQSDLDLRAFCTSTPDPALRQRLITQRSQPTAHVAHLFRYSAMAKDG